MADGGGGRDPSDGRYTVVTIVQAVVVRLLPVAAIYVHVRWPTNPQKHPCATPGPRES